MFWSDLMEYFSEVLSMQMKICCCFESREKLEWNFYDLS